MSNELALKDVMTLGQALAESKYFSDAKEASQAVVKVLAGQELGIGPIAAMSGLYIVKGKVSIGSNILASLIKASSKYNYKIVDHSTQACTIEFFESGESVGVSEFTMDDAKLAGLQTKDNWKQFPRNMLFSRALSNGAKWFTPDLFNGQTVYAPGEIEAEDETIESDLIIEAPVEPLMTTAREINIKNLMKSDDFPDDSPTQQAEWINQQISDHNFEIELVTGKEVIALRK